MQGVLKLCALCLKPVSYTHLREEELVFLCGHYEGIDERALELIVTCLLYTSRCV